MDFFKGEGYDGQLNEMWKDCLVDEGYTNENLTTMLSKFSATLGGGVVTPPTNLLTNGDDWVGAGGQFAPDNWECDALEPTYEITPEGYLTVVKT